ncbi:uncharacterized protein LOC143907022 [Temnothorax americanus]|uniref:uncharacterized protein LOC143907022 n=1 Tax=Temnothorax americanus TaxID=1964332 RepID=UPI0040684238
MGKVITRRSTDDEETAKLRRKRRKKDLDRIHSKILQARRKLDNVVKGNKDEQKRQGRAKICNRLLPEPAAGIYRNGAKGKDIQRAETVENTFHKARLKADALKLFNGDTHGSKRIVEIPTRDKTTEQSPNKDCTENSLEWTMRTLEQSPVLMRKKPSQNQKLCLIKKKGEENIFENADYNGMKQNVNDESKHGQKEDICKRRLFQNDREQFETATPTIRIFDNIDLAKENESNENEAEPTCSKNSKDLFPLSRYNYKEFWKITDPKYFEKDVLPNYHLDPNEKAIKNLRHTYADSFRQQLLRKKNRQELENVEPTYSVEYQACTSSNISQFSPVEFEVPKCSKNQTTAVRLREGSSSQKNSNLTQNTELEKSDGTRRYNSTSCSSRHTFVTYDANGPVRENCENNNTQRKSKRHDIVNFSINIPGYSQCVDNLKAPSIFLSDAVTTKRLSSKDFREKLPIAICDNSAPKNVSQKCNDRTANMCNVKNVKRVPTILRRYSNITNNKLDYSVQITGDDVEGLHKKCETNLFNRNPSNSIENESYEITSPSVLKNLTSSTTNAIFDQTKILEPQIGSMKIKDSQESQVEQFDINMYPKEHNERNGSYRHDGSFYPRTLETSRNTNVYSEKLPQQERISPDIRKHCFHSNNYRPTNYLQGASSSNSNIESTKEFPQRTKLHVYESNKQPLFRENTRNQTRNILFNNVTIPTPILNLSQDIQTEKRSTCRNMFDKTDIERAKNQVNQNACHCNEQYVYFDSANCPRKEQAHYFKETTQPESLCDTRGYNNNIDNYVNLSSIMRNVPLVSLKQNNNLHAVPKAIDNQHRAMLLQNVTQPVKYLAVKSGSEMQRIPVYINDRNVKVAENIPLKVIAVMDPSAQTKAFPQEIATQVIPLQTDSLQFRDFATRDISDHQSFVKRFDSVNAILFNPDSQSNIWYASNL